MARLEILIKPFGYFYAIIWTKNLKELYCISKRIIILVLLTSLLFLYGCTNKSINEKRLVAKSDNWVVTIDLVLTEDKYEEIPSIQYIGEGTVDEGVEVKIIHPNNSGTKNTVDTSISPNEVIGLPTRSTVDDWKDIKSVKVIWGENVEDIPVTE
ncbi:hypothetical protein ACFVQB_23695 [Paenibacillus sp. NPDC057886]|uniref:hypothetical protein n=1 Tax=Paenibacillus sp. NPDC057886 TaxID=3346270 RepID=UPI0036B1CC1A